MRQFIAVMLTVTLSYFLSPPGVTMSWWKFILLGIVVNAVVDFIGNKVQKQ